MGFLALRPVRLALDRAMLVQLTRRGRDATVPRMPALGRPTLHAELPIQPSVFQRPAGWLAVANFAMPRLQSVEHVSASLAWKLQGMSDAYLRAANHCWALLARRQTDRRVVCDRSSLMFI